ncbi:neuron derived neurotrophic factor nord isoform 1-T4 [Cochliomyia hominivorax]
MLSKAKFTQNTTKLKQNRKTTTKTIENFTLSNTTTATILKPARTTKRISKSVSTSTTVAITVKATTTKAKTTATNSPAINYQRCCWHFLLCCYCCLFICIIQPHGIQAEISSASDISGVLGVGGGGAVGVGAVSSSNAGSGINGGFSALLNNFDGAHCSSRKFNNMAKTIDDVEDLELDVPVNIAFDNRQRKRFVLNLNSSAPLNINFSQIVARKIYFNQTANLLRTVKIDQRSVVLTCALRGQYDIFVQARHRGSVKIEATALHPQANWPLLNRTHRISIRSQNRVRKRQMIVKWDKSKFDFHAVNYCLVVSTKNAHLDFCQAVEEYFTSLSSSQANRRSLTTNCQPAATIETIFSRPPERAKKIAPHITNVICTGSRTQQLIRGLAPNYIYYLDVFGVHTKRQNLTFHIASSTMHFNRTHPTVLRPNNLKMEKITGIHGVQVFSFKIPSYESSQVLRYLVLPCGGSEVDAKILKQRKLVGTFNNIYMPTYITMSPVNEGERYMIRFKPSNDDEVLRANKVALAVTTNRVFSQLPELPENITVFEVRTRCSSTKIAWYSSPEIRTMSYCIIVLNLPQRNRSSIDYTNYCMDFGKRITQHPQFHSIKCPKKAKNPPLLETDTVFNLKPGETYLIYVTANLSEGKPLPYQSLKVKMFQNCPDENLGPDSRDSPTYY